MGRVANVVRSSAERRRNHARWPARGLHRGSIEVRNKERLVALLFCSGYGETTRSLVNPVTSQARPIR